MLARFFGAARRRLGHVPHLQVLNAHHRMVLADRGRGLVQVVAAGVADTDMYMLDAGFRLLPVTAEFSFAAHGLLRFAQCCFVSLEAVEWRVERAVRLSGESGNTHVDAHRAALRNRLLDFPFRLDAHITLSAGQADGYVI